MEKLTLFCSFLCLLLGCTQLFFPRFIDDIERYLEQLLQLSDTGNLNLRRTVGFILILTGLFLIYLTYSYNFNTAL